MRKGNSIPSGKTYLKAPGAESDIQISQLEHEESKDHPKKKI